MSLTNVSSVLLWCVAVLSANSMAVADDPGVAILLVDTDRATKQVEEGLYGQSLEHINHSVVDGLVAEPDDRVDLPAPRRMTGRSRANQHRG